MGAEGPDAAGQWRVLFRAEVSSARFVARLRKLRRQALFGALFAAGMATLVGEFAAMPGVLLLADRAARATLLQRYRRGVVRTIACRENTVRVELAGGGVVETVRLNLTAEGLSAFLAGERADFALCVRDLTACRRLPPLPPAMAGRLLLAVRAEPTAGDAVDREGLDTLLNGRGGL